MFAARERTFTNKVPGCCLAHGTAASHAMAGNQQRDESKCENQFDYETDCRPPCKYGADCYQRNPLHQKKFKHPPKRKAQDELSDESKKKAKISDENGLRDCTNSSGTKTDPTFNDSGFSTEEDTIAEAILTPQQSIKIKFLVDMPEDFYSFWEFHKHAKTDTLRILLGLTLVGPFDVLSGKFKSHLSWKSSSSYLCHWRFFYDPPEFITVLAKTNDPDSQFHMGYFRDDPKEMPSFVASNDPNESCIFTAVAPNLFAAVSAYIKSQTKILKPKLSKVQMDEIHSFQVKLEKWALDHKFLLEMKSPVMKMRQKAVVAPTFHKAGIVVPVQNDVGYRPLPETDAKLKRLLQSIVDSEIGEMRDAKFDKLHEIINLIQFANDECDYGMGLELGMDLFCFGDPIFHPVIRNTLPLAYDLLDRTQYSKIISAHLSNRKKKGNLSILSE